MEPFTTFVAVAVPMPLPNVDTDQIIPARFLRKPQSAGYERWLFYDMAHASNGSSNEDFILNKPTYRSARIIVAGENFGCGSSREGAVWALKGHGFRALIASSFGDIFFINALRNGLLPVVLKPQETITLLHQLSECPGATIRIDLVDQVVHGPDEIEYRFDVDPFRKECLLKGQDDIGITGTFSAEIEAFEERQKKDWTWLSSAR